ncbi:uncharacterized protein HMPREF1541_04071 [Cyphellophora europaea CBS 101466]|uniref:OTU domain-containing protein n=1 Tax=Cyphellophora europaea (strain CBS 101466) TaxID=1220924 RepID=W2S0L1_CYPE1|nr:uncharacterized protein HMPREF1541_04071 [Cyphellophora europaea CBS 101466]ETN42130.1 hypothetical protein HMPREF1541_04071 [Cyphellophora europaea CBS 101466]
MVRKPKAVWPGLIKDGKYRYSIAGDGNCLFASLSDQLYGDPTRHPEIRTAIVEHLRNFRPLFEGHVHKDDVQQRRATRSAATIQSQESYDAFEDYLAVMSRPGTYGGEPELVAFCQIFDQDVTVHLPKIRHFDKESLFYTNEYRENKVLRSSLHIAYGGEEQGASGHYDSARNRDGSHPRNNQSPKPESQQSQNELTATVGTTSGSNDASTVNNNPAISAPTARAIRNNRSDLSHELIHDIIQKGKKEVEGSLDQLNVRARSASVSSSHRSSSSKRSLEEEGDNPRRKRADRRKSTRKRTDMSTVSFEVDEDQGQADALPNTPASTQDTETSSGVGELDLSDDDDAEYKPGDLSDSDAARMRRRKIIKPASRASFIKKSGATTQTSHLIKIAERPRSTLRT